MDLATEDARLDSYREQEIFKYLTTFIGAVGLTPGLTDWVQATLSRRVERV